MTSKSSSANSRAIIPTLYIIATPIGNIKDITVRALEKLEELDYIACEDTRVSAKLLQHYNIKAKTFSYHEHNKEFASKKIIDLLKSGNDVGLISDAGMPLVSDPGYIIVKKAISEGIKITCLPGATSSLTALSLSGLPSDSFYFQGFLPNKSGARIKKLEAIKHIKSTLIFFESARRLSSSLIDMQKVLGDIEVVVARELTKRFEEIKRGNVSELVTYYEKNGAPKGEIVIVVKNDKKDELSQAEIDKLISKQLKTDKVKDTAKKLAEKHNLNKNEIYKRALELKDA